MAKAAQPRFVLPRACITPQGMPTEAHEVYRLREVRRLTYKAIGYLLHRSSNGGLITLLRAATALLQAQEAVLGAEAYGVLLAGVHGGVAQLAAPSLATAAAAVATPGAPPAPGSTATATASTTAAPVTAPAFASYGGPHVQRLTGPWGVSSCSTAGIGVAVETGRRPSEVCITMLPLSTSQVWPISISLGRMDKG